MPQRLAVTSPRAIHALTNPTRLLAFDELYSSQRPRTASDLARVAGIKAPTMTYHLQVLEAVKLVRRAPRGARDGRERPWMACAKDYMILSNPQTAPADKFVLIDALLNPQRTRMQQIMRDHSFSWVAGRAFVVLHSVDLRLTEAERRRLYSQLTQIWDRYTSPAQGRPAAKRYERVTLQWSLLPTDPLAGEGRAARGAETQ